MPEYEMDQIHGALTRALNVNIREALELTNRYYGQGNLSADFTDDDLYE